MQKIKFTLTLAIVMLLGFTVLAQSPMQFKYQAVIRDANNLILTNQNIGLRLSILKTSATGNIEYSESHTVVTNQFGVVNISVGSGTLISGSMSSINWGSDLHFLKVDVDLTGGSNYQFMGTTQLLSVPYAIHAISADSINETDPVFNNSVA